MADLLRSGYTMLNMACPVCNNPIFRSKDENIFCPTCNRKVLIVNDKVQQNNRIERNDIYTEKTKETTYQNRQIKLNNLLLDIVNEKIEMIATKLKNETDSQIIETYTKILLNCLDILNKIQLQEE